jgi:phosphocarrier protein FPr
LGAGKGSNITLMVDGADEDQALADIEAAIRAGLGDEDHGTPVEAKPAPVQAEASTVLQQTVEVLEPGVIKGVGAAPGIAVGPIFHFQHAELDIDKAEPVMALDEALKCAKDQLTTLHQQMTDKKLGAEAAIFEAHRELLDDPELLQSVDAHTKTGKNTLNAWQAAIAEQAAAIAALNDPLLAARADDLRDVGKRVLRLMLGLNENAASMPTTPVVIAARELSPSDTASFKSEFVLGFGVVEGGPTSHIAILARALGLPAIVGVDESMLAIEEKTPVILNGNDGTLTVNPAPDVLDRAKQSQKRYLEYRRFAQEQASLPAISQDGIRVDVTANAGSIADAAEALHMGADGIGLLRTEFLFLERTTKPTEDEQFSVYNAVAETMRSLPVIVRTLDIGGDKPLAYIQMKPELNPFLGERGIRLCLNRPELFKEQLRAILRAAPSGNLKIMFPMVSDIMELRQARAIIEELCRELNVSPVQIGIMIEVPSAALMADVFAPEIDFFSIGTNDLTQYTLAMDRGNSALASKHDGLHPAVLRLIAMTIDAAHKYGKRADICGELGSDAAAIPILLGLGMDELSVSIPSVPTVKAQVRALKIEDWRGLAREALNCSTAKEVRELVKKQLA